MNPRSIGLISMVTGLCLLIPIFQNCGESKLILPQSAPPTQDIASADIAKLEDIAAFVSDEVIIAPMISGSIDLQADDTDFVWLKDGVPLADATESQLTLKTQTIEDAGLYTFQVLSRGEVLSSIQVNVSLTHHTSCLEILNANNLKPDGNYMIDIDGDAQGNSPMSVSCDMTTDSGGWTLVARVLANSTDHTTAQEIGELSSPDQLTTAKFSDALINQMTFTHLRMNIENTLTVYFQTSSVDLTGAVNFNLPNQAAEAFAGPYNLTYSTQNNCGSDCIVAGIQQTNALGRFCGYRYLISGNNAAPGMGCENTGGNRAGHVWVR